MPDSPPTTAGGTEFTLRFVPNEEWMRQCYDDYVGDVAWYRENDQLDPKHPDAGYRTGDVPSYEEFRAELITGFLDEIADQYEPGWHLERVGG